MQGPFSGVLLGLLGQYLVENSFQGAKPTDTDELDGDANEQDSMT